MAKKTNSETTPGINPNVDLSRFSIVEQRIIEKLGKEWYITHGGQTIELGTSSSYKFFLMKPTVIYQELFNLEREIIVVFSDYTSFEPRTLDAFEKAATYIQDLRVEKVCSVLISSDLEVEIKLKQLLRNDAEHQVIVPFTYSELMEYFTGHFIRNRFKEHFYSRDLFAYQSALKRDIYFFGRSDLIHNLVNRHRSNESSGLFGLRKTGKTSIIFGIQRAIKNNEGISVFLDCQNPSLHGQRWYKVLNLIISEIKNQNHIEALLKSEDEYLEESAPISFEKDILKLSKKVNGKNILLIFDEIEHISPKISLSSHWKDGNDFILLWQTLRSLSQKHTSLFTYLIVGTNPKCVETPFINGVDNPIFNQIPYDYIPPFDVSQTKEMVEKIGRMMGLNFDEILFSKLNEDFGGHPFLMRNVCSVINKLAKDRPTRIDKDLYEKGKNIFNQDYGSYYDMILSVLKEYYIDEYEMLKFLALGDIEQFNDFASISNEYTNHLIGYNILDKNRDAYFFRIESIKQHLVRKNKFKKIKLTTKEKYGEISERRNDIEGKLRIIARTTLTSVYGENIAKEKILNLMGSKRKTEYYSLSLKDIFNPNKSQIYFDDLRKLILSEWPIYEHIFGRDRQGFDKYMDSINKYRVEAHAKDMTDEDMNYFRVCASKLETFIESFL